MADFLSNLWSSVFTPGPTPTLLVATNATFAALQLLLVALLAVTYSVHFAILSILCAGLWYSINWFAGELAAADAAQQTSEKEAAEQLRRKKRPEINVRRRSNIVEDSADDEGEDTEVDDGKGMKGSGTMSTVIVEPHRDIPAAQAVGVSSATALDEQSLRRRKSEDVDRSGEISTDSEWEKISQHEDR